jgi:hypothetical protein
MRSLLEYLGIARPNGDRREPVVLPAWVRWGAPLALALMLTLLATVATGAWLLVRSLLP